MTLMAQSIGALAVVLAIFAGLVWGLRRLQGATVAKAESHMQVVQRLHLDSKNSVVEIKHGSKHYLLGVGQSGVQKIADVSDEDASQDIESIEVLKDNA
ncbi:MAG: flagellar biosynthetic protein FliO [Ghiorsea sp.]